MAIAKIEREWNASTNSYVCEFILDSVDDVKNLPKACAGSTAIIAKKGGAIYMVNASGNWEEF